MITFDEVLYIDENNALTKFTIMVGKGININLIEIMLIN